MLRQVRRSIMKLYRLSFLVFTFLGGSLTIIKNGTFEYSQLMSASEISNPW